MSSPLLQLLKKKSFPTGPYLVTSTDTTYTRFIVDEFTEKLLEKYPDVSLLKYAYPDHSLPSILQDAVMTDFFVTKRLFLIRGIEETPKQEQKILTEFFNHSFPETLVLFVDLTGVLSSDPQKRPLLQLFQSHKRGFLLRYGTYEFKEILLKRLKQKKISLTSKEIDQLIELCGPSFEKILPEAEKLHLFKTRGEKSDASPVDRLISLTQESNNFQLIESLLSRNLKNFTRELSLFFEKGEEFLAFLGFLNNVVTTLRLYQSSSRNDALFIERYTEIFKKKPSPYYQKICVRFGNLSPAYLLKLEQIVMMLEWYLKSHPPRIQPPRIFLLFEEAITGKELSLKPSQLVSR